MTYLPSSQTDKDALARRIMAADGITRGLVGVLSCVEPCQSFEIRRDRDTQTHHALKRKFGRIWRHLDERGRRMMAANEAVHEGYGGVSRISRVCGLSRGTITKGIRELGRHRSRPAGSGGPAGDATRS